ncbi:hypothetical protein [Thiomicrorhabdus sp. 6S3-12]|uniref:hypothetical protein n=1 Tax=Thiomicrorhabdus sp. 6S3-12 TaxID=2819681 RepID=UPI001AACDDE4|nr:hypothetical protein [Thiomicrorhabdus sp. 6S3-12]MBO1923859.1 hypothetical protein [Thiomicrorhabdus sp. 6S3-12]
MLFVVVIAIIAGLWLSSKQGTIIGNFKNKAIEKDFIDIRVAKQRLLQFALLTPELYYDVDISGVVKPPLGPGYFPCPDNVDGTGADGIADWVQCSTGGADMMLSGVLPRLAYDPANPASPLKPFFAFAEEGRYLYYVDKRYVLPSRDFTDNLATATIDEDGLYAPLTPIKIEDAVDADNGGAGVGALSLNGADGFIAVVIDLGSDGVASDFYVDGTDFRYPADPVSGLNKVMDTDDPRTDKLVAISYEQDWLQLFARRICRENAKYTNDYDNYIDNDGDGNTDPVYTGYDGTKNVDIWKLEPSWFYWEESPKGWYEWSSICP